MSVLLTLDREAIVALCRRHGVVRLAVFGSALTDRFDPKRSDVDLTVEFAADLPDRVDAYFGLKEDLELLLGRPVDLLVRTAIDNPVFRGRGGSDRRVALCGLKLPPCSGTRAMRPS